MSLQTALLSSSSFGLVLLKNSPKSVGFVKVSSSSNGKRTVVRCASNINEKDQVLFHPFEEVKKPEFAVPVSPHMSLSRQSYSDECEAAVNEQINVQYSVSYVYDAMQAYLERDNIALNGIASFFWEICEDKRKKADLLRSYQNKRGGRVKLNTIVGPPSEFEHEEKGDALYVMELALSLEKLGHEKLRSLHAVARNNNDPQLEEFIESSLLKDQVKGINILSNYVSQLREVGKGYGAWNFDKPLLEAYSSWV